MVNDPIHAATAIETATVTAINMMAATTGLSAFLFLRMLFSFYLSPAEFKITRINFNLNIMTYENIY